MRSVCITCVNPRASHVQKVAGLSTLSPARQSVPTRCLAFPLSMHTFSTQQSTGFLPDLTDGLKRLSPQSTAPITTTTLI